MVYKYRPLNRASENDTIPVVERVDKPIGLGSNIK
jgi:hypothetical protein